jgi:hypothetical protein
MIIRDGLRLDALRCVNHSSAPSHALKLRETS